MSKIEVAGIPDYAGRVIALNVSKCKRFSCGNFALSSYSPICTVSPNASMAHVHQGVLDGRLLDVTDQPKHGLAIGSTQHEPARELGDTGKRIFMGTDTAGNLFIVTPKDAEEESKFIAEIEATGTLKLNYERGKEMASGITPPKVENLITITDLD